MANIFDRIFGTKKVDQNQGSPLDKDIPGFIDLRKNVEGMKMGYGDEYVERATNPYAQQARASWSEQLKPAMEESYGSRGLSRSTIAGRDIGRAEAGVNRDINEQIAQAYLQNLQQSKTDQQNQQQMLYNMGVQEAAQRNRAAENEQERSRNQIAYNQANADRDTMGLNRMLGIGGTLLAPAIGGALGAIGQGISGLGGGIGSASGGYNTGAMSGATAGNNLQVPDSGMGYTPINLTQPQSPIQSGIGQFVSDLGSGIKNYANPQQYSYAGLGSGDSAKVLDLFKKTIENQLTGRK